MQAAKKRNGMPARTRRSDAQGSVQPLATADDTALLDALPIAAAVVGRMGDGSLNVLAHNSRFLEAVARSTCAMAVLFLNCS